MKSNDLVTVIIPTYNRADYLREAITSVLSQSYEHFELLILDNCSDDHTQEIIKSFSDSRICYVRHLCNIGGAANWTYGVKLAQGKYLSILGDDDKYQEDFLLRRVQMLSQYPESAAVCSSYSFMNSNGEITGTASLLSNRVHFLKDRELLCFMRDYTWFLGATLYVTEVVKSLWDLIVARCGACGDIGLNFLLATKLHGQVIWLPKVDYCYRIHNGQDSIENRIVMLMDGPLVMELILSRGYCERSKDIIHTISAKALNTVGRVLWDEGNFRLSIYYFLKELSFGPFRFKTWLRVLRSFWFIIFKKPQKYSTGSYHG